MFKLQVVIPPVSSDSNDSVVDSSDTDYDKSTVHGTRDDIDSNDGRDCNDSVDVESFLIPSYQNKPDVDDMFALQWGLHHYIKYFPSMRRPPYS